MFCAPGLFFGGTEGVWSRFHVLRARLVFGGTEGVGSRFQVLSSRTRFRRYRGRRVPFSCFARPDSFSAIPRASNHVSTFCAPELIFGGTEGVRNRFDVLCAHTRFRPYRGCWVPFSCYAHPDTLSAVPRASNHVSTFCAPELIFGGTEGVRNRFDVLCAQTHFRRYRGRQVPFSCFALSNLFSAVPRASFSVFMLCAQTHFRRYRVHRVPFSCFARPDSFSTVPRVSGPVFIFYAPRLIFGGN
jgi:hypothetical protein